MVRGRKEETSHFETLLDQRCGGGRALQRGQTQPEPQVRRLGLESEAVTDGDAVAGDVVKELNTRAGLYYSASLAGLERLERGAAVR